MYYASLCSGIHALHVSLKNHKTMISISEMYETVENFNIT